MDRTNEIRMPETNVTIEFEVIFGIVTPSSPGLAVERVTAATPAIDSLVTAGQVHWQVVEVLIAVVVVPVVVSLIGVVAVV